MIYDVALISAVQRSDPVTHIQYRFHIVVHHRPLNVVPYTTHQDPAAHPFPVLSPFASADTQTPFIPCLPLSLETARLISVPVSLFLFHRCVDLQRMLDPRVSDTMWSLPFSF